MADDVTLPGTGANIATDDVGGVQHQKIKMEFGADGAATLVSDTAPMPTKPERAATGAVVPITASITVVTLKASNTSRKGLAIYNASTGNLYVRFEAGASLTTYSVRLQPDQYWELPLNPLYTGIVTGIWDIATGSAMVTEFT